MTREAAIEKLRIVVRNPRQVAGALVRISVIVITQIAPW